MPAIRLAECSLDAQGRVSFNLTMRPIPNRVMIKMDWRAEAICFRPQAGGQS